MAALQAAMAAALLMMVCNLTLGKKRYAEVQDQIDRSRADPRAANRFEARGSRQQAEIVVDELCVDAQSGFEKPDIFIAGAKQAFDASADANASFHQVGAGYLQTGDYKRDRKFLRDGGVSDLRQPAYASL